MAQRKTLRERIRRIIYGTASSVSSLVARNNIDYGVVVNHDSALRFTAVFAAIKILSENIASLPKQVLKETSRGFEAAKNHAAYKLFIRPNGYMDCFTFWFSMIASLLGKGNCLAIIERENGKPVAMHYVDWENVTIKFVNGQKMYIINITDSDFNFLNGTYFDWEVIHIMWYSLNGLVGIDPITYNAASIGRGIATQKFSSEFYSHGGQIKGTLETDNNLGDEAYENFMKHYHEAAKNFDTPLLEYGIKYKSIGISPIAAQLIQSETLSIQDIARIFSIPPHLLAEMSHSTFSNIEQQNIFFSIYSLRPLCKRIEQQLELKLFSEAERGKYSIKFDLKGMMRGDDASRAAYYSSGINTGWMTPNEARALEGMQKLDGLDTPRRPLNYVDVGSEADKANQASQITNAQ